MFFEGEELVYDIIAHASSMSDAAGGYSQNFV